MRRGTTLIEVAVVLCVTGTLAAVAVPGFRRMADRAAARGAAEDFATVCSTARHLAVLRSKTATVVIDENAGIVSTQVGDSVVSRRDFGEVYEVVLDASRSRISYGPAGLATGVSNVRFIAARGAAAETVTVSRLGRVR